MKAQAPTPDEAERSAVIEESDLQRQERFEDELVMHLERDQFVTRATAAGEEQFH